MIKTLRMGRHQVFKDETFAKYLELVRNNLDVIDEIAILWGTSHNGYCPYEKELNDTRILQDRILQFKKLGIKKVGVNILCTLGHTEDGSATLQKANLQYMVNEKGIESGSCLCPADERFMDYITKRYTLYASLGADFIWLDDDVRIGNHGVVSGFCYCPKCIQKFNERYDTNYNFDDITSRWEKDADLRKKWEKSTHNTMIQMLSAIKDVIKSFNPSIEIGYMSGSTNCVYEWIEACDAVKGRPGGGFYTDRFVLELFEKSFSIQRQLSNYPKAVTDIQYEYEDYNGRTLEKSLHTSEMETSLCIMAGCNGILYNKHEHTQSFLDMMRKSAKKWDILSKINEGCSNSGVFCSHAISAQYLNEISIPVTANFENAVAAFILGEEWNKYDNTMVEKILHKNVLTDGSGLEILNERGFEAFVGGNVKNVYKNGVDEVFSQHVMNEEFKGYSRHISMDIYYETDAYEVEMANEAECLSILSGNHGISMYKYISSKGTKFIGDGCLMPGQMQTASKRTQMMNVYDWLADNKLPVIIKKSIKVIPTVTTDSQGTVNIMLTNASFDKTGNFDLVVRGKGTFVMIGADGEPIPLRQTEKEQETVIHINNIDGWNYMIITNSDYNTKKVEKS